MNIFLGPILFLEAVYLLFTSSRLITRALIPGGVAFIITLLSFFMIHENFSSMVSWSSWLSDFTQSFPIFDWIMSLSLTILLAPFHSHGDRPPSL